MEKENVDRKIIDLVLEMITSWRPSRHLRLYSQSLKKIASGYRKMLKMCIPRGRPPQDAT
jgi:hypothetical protein